MKTTPLALQRLEEQLGRLLVTGVTLSAVLLLLGIVIFLGWPGAAAASWLFTAGLLTLMATPMLRVVVSVVEYVKLRDWFFVATTLLVLAELTLTVVYAVTR